jgi:hypothetical protein
MVRMRRIDFAMAACVGACVIACGPNFSIRCTGLECKATNDGDVAGKACFNVMITAPSGEHVSADPLCTESVQAGSSATLPVAWRGNPLMICPEIEKCRLEIKKGTIETVGLAKYTWLAWPVLIGLLLAAGWRGHQQQRAKMQAAKATPPSS